MGIILKLLFIMSSNTLTVCVTGAAGQIA